MDVSVAYLPKACIHHYYHGEIFFKLKVQICKAQNRRSREMAKGLFDTCNNTIIPHGEHMFQTAPDMEMATICAYK